MNEPKPRHIIQVPMLTADAKREVEEAAKQERMPAATWIRHIIGKELDRRKGGN